MGVPLDAIKVNHSSVTKLRPQPLDSLLGPLLVGGQMSVVYGPERAPMTALAHVALVGAVRNGRKALYLDSGKNFSPQLVRTLSRDLGESALLDISIGNVMSLSDLNKAALSAVGFSIVVLDSLTGVLNLSGAPGAKGRQRELFSTLDMLRMMVNQHGSHLLMTDHSTREWSSGAEKPIGGNVLAHAVDSVVRVDSQEGVRDAVRVLVERSASVASPEAVVIRLGKKGAWSLMGR